MQDQIYKFLVKLEPFSKLPEAELEKISDSVFTENFASGHNLSVQGRSKLDHIYIIKDGLLELFYESDGEKELGGTLQSGEIFGGISILMNAGISVRSVKIVEDTTLYVLPKKVFLDICTLHTDIYEYFAEKFRHRMMNKSYASVVAAGQALHFLHELAPFSFLPEEDVEKMAAAISIINYPKDTVLFVQGQSKVEYLYIIQKGAAERYFEENDEKTLRGMIGEGDMYGGISMLMNNGLAIRPRILIFIFYPKNCFWKPATGLRFFPTFTLIFSANECWTDPMPKSLPSISDPPSRRRSFLICR